MQRSVRSGGRPSAARSAVRPLTALREMRLRYDGIDDLLASWLDGELPSSEFEIALEHLYADVDVDEAYSSKDPPLAGEEAIRLSQILQRISIARGALSLHESRLIDAEANVRTALMGADIERRLVPAYMAEFCALLQLNGIVRTHLNDIPKAKLARVLEILKGQASDVFIEGDELADTQPDISEPGMWDDIDLSVLPYEIVEREAADDADLAVLQMRLPEVDDPRELGVSGGLFDTFLGDVERFGETAKMINSILPEWERRSGVVLSEHERRVWAFLLVIVRYARAVVSERPEDISFDGLLLPGPKGSTTIREIRAKATSPA